MRKLKRKTTCVVQDHGTRCEAAREKEDLYSRTTEKRLALRFEMKANA